MFLNVTTDDIIDSTVQYENIADVNNTGVTPNDTDVGTTATPPDDYHPIYDNPDWPEALWWRVTTDNIADVGAAINVALATFGNVMAVLVSRRLKSTMSVYIMALACSDMITVFMGSARWIFGRFLGFNLAYANAATCRLTNFLLYACPVYSAWLLVAMTTHRAVSVVWPHRINAICTMTKTRITVIVLAVLVFAIHAWILATFRLEVIENDIKSCGSELTDMLERWKYVDVILQSFLPFVCLMVSNGVLIQSVLSSLRHAQSTLSGSSDQMEARKKKTSSMTVTLVLTSIAFVVLSLPVAVQRFLVPDFTPDNLIEFGKWYFAYCITYQAWQLNSAINFYIYCLAGNKMREEFKKMVCCCWCKGKARQANGAKMPAMSAASGASGSNN